MLYKDLNLKTQNQTRTISIQGQDINVLQYLPVRDKNDLVQIALQSARENGVVNEIKLEVFFNLFIVYFYTDLVFSDEERSDPFQLYDELQSNGILTRILGALNEHEYGSLVDYLDEMRGSQDAHENSAAGVIRMFVQDLPKNASEAAELLKNVDLSKYEQVNKFAEAANGGRPISDSLSNLISSTPNPNTTIHK